ncbi:chloride channel protein [Candidatus Manganitrophus noduliformans]|uniref:Chloride channel protein n=1 Tax=Candidatus Manganitrophus noduliformans TaxID=2606439 RepID=A0A7X6DQX4_9BACT|nr:chloride channel protein [Candidatus Manganitrophus noduliformans]NKE71757.1 chloride channel protein [Candidatus Manganitrophus noduliformans]
MAPVSKSSTTEGLPVAPALEAAHVPQRATRVDRRVVQMTFVAVLIALVAGVIAQGLAHLIDLITNIAFYGRFALTPVSPAGHQLGIFVLFVPVVGGILVGFMARYGSKSIRGHGIPEAMEQVLINQSRIPARMAFLKPISAAIAIGTGGPFGAEGPIIATGGALGSVVGQLLKTTADERKILLSAGAAAGMSATFGSPVSAVLLAIELLLFEFRPRSFIPVALASVTAAAVRMGFVGAAPAFAMPELAQPAGAAIASYIFLGAAVGVVSVYITRAVYAIEDGFEHLPIHWMWWPALGAVAVGVIGYAVPRTLGIGYENIEEILSGEITGQALVILFTFKFISWAVSLGSGTSGGTLAPLFTIGGGLGAALGSATLFLFPHIGLDVRVAALVGMAAIFAGASRALLASVVFAFETTMQPLGLLPLLGGCTAAYLVSSLLMKHTIMTEKIARRGVQVLTEYTVDSLAQTLVRESASYPAVSLKADMTVEQVRSWVALDLPESRHQGFPILDPEGRLIGVLTRRDLFDPNIPVTTPLRELIKRPPAVVFEAHTLREAADLMVEEDIGRLPVITRSHPSKVVAMLTRSDLLLAHRKRLEEAHQMQQSIRWGKGPSASG